MNVLEWLFHKRNTGHYYVWESDSHQETALVMEPCMKKYGEKEKKMSKARKMAERKEKR